MTKEISSKEYEGLLATKTRRIFLWASRLLIHVPLVEECDARDDAMKYKCTVNKVSFYLKLKCISAFFKMFL